MFLLLLALAIAAGGALIWWLIQVLIPAGEGAIVPAVIGWVGLLLVFGLVLALWCSARSMRPSPSSTRGRSIRRGGEPGGPGCPALVTPRTGP